MGKKLKTNNKDSKKANENLNLSSIINKTKKKLSSTKKNDLTKLNTTVIFTINSNPLFQEEFEKEYQKRYLFYLREEFNSKVLTMFFNYISLTKTIPNSYKNNRYFLKEFIKIIFNLLINEIDLVAITLILDSMGWIKEGTDPWKYIYYISLKAKEKFSSENSLSFILKILEKNNPGFTDSYNKWASKKNDVKGLNVISVAKTNERFRELMKPIFMNESQNKFINYNEIVIKIIEMSKMKENIVPSKNIKIKENLNDINKIQYPLEPGLLRNSLNPSIIFDGPLRMGQQLDIPPPSNQSFYDSKFLDLSRGGSRNNSSFLLYSSLEQESFRIQNMKK